MYISTSHCSSLGTDYCYKQWTWCAKCLYIPRRFLPKQTSKILVSGFKKTVLYINFLRCSQIKENNIVWIKSIINIFRWPFSQNIVVQHCLQTSNSTFLYHFIVPYWRPTVLSYTISLYHIDTSIEFIKRFLAEIKKM